MTYGDLETLRNSYDLFKKAIWTSWIVPKLARLLFYKSSIFGMAHFQNHTDLYCGRFASNCADRLISAVDLPRTFVVLPTKLSRARRPASASFV